MIKRITATLVLVVSLTTIMAGCGNNRETEQIAVTEETPIPIVEIVEHKLPYEPVNIEYRNGSIIKTFVVPKAADLYVLVEEPFTEGDFDYSALEIQKKTVPGDIEKKVVTQIIPVDVPNNNQAEALSWYSPELDYNDEEGFSGRVQLNSDTLTIEAKGSKKYSYQITDSKQFLNLVRNDPSTIPRTTTKNGRILELVNVDWQVADQAMAGDSLIATRYNATAHYAATAQGSRVTGYTANAVYTGEVSRQGESKISCSVVYQGTLTTQGFMKRLVVPLLVAALVLAIVLPIILRKRKLQQIKEGANRPTRKPSAEENTTDQEAQQAEAKPVKNARFRAWREKRKERKPIFVEVADEEGEPGKAKIYLPKEEGEDEQHENT